MKALILAAGYGTRLSSIAKDKPKALLEVKGRPILEYILQKLEPLKDIDEVFVVTNDKFYSVFREWAERQKVYSRPIVIINDGTQKPEERLGSIGDIQFVLKNKNIAEDLLVIGGDNLFDYSLKEYIIFARSKFPYVSIGLYDIGNKEAAKNLGIAALDQEKKIISFEEKPLEPQGTLAAMCLYFFPNDYLQRIDHYLEETGNKDRAGDYIRWLYEKSKVYGFQFSGRWYDIGSVESYKEAQSHFVNQY